MISRSKAALVIILALLLVAAALYFFFFRTQQPVGPGNSGNQADCLIFQNENPSGPCYRISPGANIPGGQSGQTGSQPVGTSTATSSGSVSVNTPDTQSGNAPSVALTSSDRVTVARCSSSDTDAENACIKNAAVTTKRVSLCAGISEILPRVDCVSSVGRTEKNIQEVFSKPTVSVTALASSSQSSSSGSSSGGTSGSAGSSGSGSQSTRNPSSVWAQTLAAMSALTQNTKNYPDSTFTAEGLANRIAEGAGLKLYAFSEYQVAPGTTITAQGAGFAKTNNTLYIGGNSISGLSSADGMTISFQVPSMSNGTYEAWVENSKGSSRNPSMPVSLFVTSTPAPRPVITRVSPANPVAGDRLTFYGENFGSSITVMTTMGVKQNVSASDGSFSINMADLEHYNTIKDSPRIAGTKVSAFVHIQNSNGTTRQPFVFDIQF